MNKEFWEGVYSSDAVATTPSRFARFCLPLLRGSVVDLGCGNGRDVYFFHENGIPVHGVDAANEDYLIIKQDIGAYIRQNKCPGTVYARFLWHAIEPELQEEILRWSTGRLLLEARTTEDKPKNVVGRHSRHLVNVKKLEKQLSDLGYAILSIEAKRGFSPYDDEDPHLVRVVADRRT